MNRITASLAALGTAAVITTGAIFFAPSGAPAGSAAPGTAVAVSLVETNGDALREGDVTTTFHRVTVVGGRARTGDSVTSSTKASFSASLPDGEYLVKAVISDRELAHFDDIDGTAAVPDGSRCDPLTDCTWIVVRDGTWSLKVGGSQTHTTAEFRFTRRAPVPTTTVPQTPPPTTAPANAVPANDVTANDVTRTTPVVARQEVQIKLVDETDGLSPDSPPVAGAVTLLRYSNADGVLFTTAAVTDSTGTATHHFPPGVYSVQLIPPAGYTLSYVPILGPHDPDPEHTLMHPFTVVRTAPRQTTGGVAPAGDTPAESTPAVTPAAPQPSPTPTPAPQPEPAPQSPPEPQPEPGSQPEPAAEPQPDSTPQPEPEPEARPEPGGPGCDHSDDPEIQALLWTNDGAIRWLVDGELMTLWPEPGMEPVRVCLDAYHRLTELGIDIDYYTTY